jgi:hypothetical protein
MEFNIQALCAAESVESSTRVLPRDVLGTEFEFRSGISFKIAFPELLESFPGTTDIDKLLCSIFHWNRVYRYPENDNLRLHTIALADGAENEIEFYRLDFLQPPPQSRRGLRPPIEVTGGKVMSYQECVDWLISLCDDLSSIPANKKLILQNPRLVKPVQIRVAFVGVDHLDGEPLLRRVTSIGAVYGAEIVHISPAGFVDTKARLASRFPFDAAILVRHRNPHLSVDLFPASLNRNMVYECIGFNPSVILEEIEACIELFVSDFNTRLESPVDDDDLLLKIVLRGMLSHSKIGQYMHCSKDQALTGIRARRLNVPKASRLLDENSEKFQDNKDSDKLLLFKPHNDGDQYFINPRRVPEAKALAGWVV